MKITQNKSGKITINFTKKDEFFQDESGNISNGHFIITKTGRNFVDVKSNCPEIQKAIFNEEKLGWQDGEESNFAPDFNNVLDRFNTSFRPLQDTRLTYDPQARWKYHLLKLDDETIAIDETYSPLLGLGNAYSKKHEALIFIVVPGDKTILAAIMPMPKSREKRMITVDVSF